jgi:hypothetical protein
MIRKSVKRFSEKIMLKQQPEARCNRIALLGIEYNAGRAGKGVSSMRRKMVLVSALLAILPIAAFACWPRRADLRAFDSAGMARLETAMWRDYYEKRYGALFYHLYARAEAMA